MNRIGELKKSVPGILLILCLILPFFVRNTKADNGPKPSITIRVKNAPQDYFIALSGGGSDSRDRNEKIKLKEANPGEKESKAIDLLFTLGVHTTPVGKSCYRSSGITYTFGYMVPKNFHVILVTLDGEVFTSNDVTKVRFNAVFDYDVSTGELVEQIEDGRKRFAANIIVNYLLTLLLEGLILFAFGYASKKANWIHFLIANTVTQALLNVYLACNITDGMASLYIMMDFFFIEFVIFLMEGIYYAATLRGKDDAKDGKLSFLYAAVANLFSLTVGALVYIAFWNSILQF